jgi:pimeloyl-ACP methyl ester carboxylesterase
MTASVTPARPNNSTTVRTTKRPPFKLRAVRGGMGMLSCVSPAVAAAVAERLFLTPRRHARPAQESAVLSKAEALVLPTEYGNLAAWKWDPVETPRDLIESRASFEAGHPRVLLVHGWEGRGSQLGALVEPLTAAGFSVVTFDAPGHGDSPGERASIFHFAEAIEQAAARFGPFHAIVTHSMGGASMLWANRHAPLASRLVMIAPPVDLRDFTRTLSGVLGLPEEVREGVHRRLGARFGVSIEEVRSERLAAAMHGPALVIHDENDREVPVACGEAIARAWPGAELLRTQGLGHQRILRDRATLDAVVRFVTQGRELSTTRRAFTS